MSKKADIYQVVYRGEWLQQFVPGGWVFFQRNIEYGGGYWLGRTYHDVFILEYDRPTSLHDGIKFILEMRAAELNFATFDDDFELI
ncbi:hypothetical protein [Serratia nevei]|uniref:hypothetical protein n=1 Tax=Serratia nevei TaxID=2703794 RepID=UPI00249A798B|nr:hypothetical protein [Serratia nevei]MDI3149332.1 hypothetical protein [Serratia nevei]